MIPSGRRRGASLRGQIAMAPAHVPPRLRQTSSACEDRSTEQGAVGMHAVIVDVAINDLEQSQQELRERVVPMVSQVPGFVSGVWINAGEGKGHSVVVFESEEAANTMAEQVRSVAPAAVTVENVSIHEVVAHV
jgi:hypothetical protein